MPKPVIKDQPSFVILTLNAVKGKDQHQEEDVGFRMQSAYNSAWY